MSNLSVRLPPDLEQRLTEQAQLSHKRRSDLVREAVGEYVARMERARLMEEMAREMREAYADPQTQRAQRELAEEGLNEWIESVETDERAGGIDPNEKWWK